MNWQTMLQEIRDSGLSVTTIAEKCNTKRTTISDLIHGYSIEPKYQLALQIDAMHKRVMRRKPT
jgi:hypothetical protein